MSLKLITLLMFVSLAACQGGSGERTISGFAQGYKFWSPGIRQQAFEVWQAKSE